MDLQFIKDLFEKYHNVHFIQYENKGKSYKYIFKVNFPEDMKNIIIEFHKVCFTELNKVYYLIYINNNNNGLYLSNQAGENLFLWLMERYFDGDEKIFKEVYKAIEEYQKNQSNKIPKIEDHSKTENSTILTKIKNWWNFRK